MSLINETVTLGCYTVLLRQERCPRTGWKCRAPHGFSRCFSQPRPGLLPSSASAAAFAQVYAASSGVPREDKELIISNYKLGSEHYAPCQGRKLTYLHCTGFWGAPRKRRWQQGKHLGSSGTGVTAAHPTAQSPLENTYFWERLWKWEVSKELAQPEQSCQHCMVQHAGLRRMRRVRAGSAPKATRTSAPRERAGTTLELSPHGRAVWADAAGSAGPCTGDSSRGTAPAASPAVLPSCTGSSASAPTRRRCLSSP